MRSEHARVFISECRELLCHTCENRVGSLIVELTRALFDLIAKVAHRGEVVLIGLGKREDDRLFRVFSLELLVFVLARPNYALNSRVLRDKESADLTGCQEREKAGEIDHQHEEGHDPDENEVQVALE